MTIPDPDCMSDDELALWRAGAVYLSQWFRVPMIDPCADCVPSFAAEMGAIGRCNGTPGVSRMPVTERPTTDAREANRASQERWRLRNRDAIRERRRAYFAARHRRNTATLDEPRTGTLG